jgi:ATP:ADP antiporter, AAA family
MLLGMVATAFAAAQTQVVGEQVEKASGQLKWLATNEALCQSLVLVLQLCATGRLLRRWSPIVFLCLLPTLAIAGLWVLWLWPFALVVSWVQVVRRGGQFAFEKPAREALYTPFDVVTKHKVKFLLDTVAFRFGDLLGAWFQVWLRAGDLGPGGIAWATVGLAVIWAAIGIALGVGARSRDSYRPADASRPVVPGDPVAAVDPAGAVGGDAGDRRIGERADRSG